MYEWANYGMIKSIDFLTRKEAHDE